LLNQVKLHAEQLGCDCGSDEWLKELHLFYNAHGFSEGS
jgi:hypothetical protein